MRLDTLDILDNLEHLENKVHPASREFLAYPVLQDLRLIFLLTINN